MAKQHASSHYRETTNRFGEKIMIPVVNVTDGMAERALGMQMIKATNRSKYITYNDYHLSPKKKTNI